VAVPIAPAETIAGLTRLADEVVCLEAPDCFNSVGQFYRDFTQVSDQAVAELLALSRTDVGTDDGTIPIDELAGGESHPTSSSSSHTGAAVAG
jgi:hypothetical protein